MLGWSINLFRIRGIQLALHFSFVLLLAYFAYDGYLEGGLAGMAWSSACLIAFFTCVVLHELGHSLTARRFGIQVRRILLMPIGGMAEFSEIPRQPSREILITLAGPAVNFAIAGLLWPFVSVPDGWDAGATPTSLAGFGFTLWMWNLMMGSFNLVPVFPMDGGRILRALLATRLPYLRATLWAVTVARVLAAAGIVLGLYLQLYLLAALFAFILFAGTVEYRALRFREEQEAHWREMTARLYSVRAVIPPLEEPPLL